VQGQKINMFEFALNEMPAQDPTIWGPASFQDYLAENGILDSPRTAANISVDHKSKLAAELRDRDTMILRLGKSQGTGTQFALVQVPGRLNDFFFLEQKLFDDDVPTPFIPERTFFELFPFSLFANHSETNLVNAAFCSGLITTALKLDRSDIVPFPATGASNVTFEFSPHTELSTPLLHDRGQVQVDGVFVGKREGQQYVFVLEAKVDPPGGTTAKHKLLYSVLAIAPSVPEGIDIVAIYVQFNRHALGTIIRICECSIPDPRKSIVAINQLEPVSCASYRFPKNMLSI
jgi:hypothetical protein